MATMMHNNLKRFMSFNSRGFNESKQCYIRSILSGCDWLFLQEHWLSEDQLCWLNGLSNDHVAVGVSGFGNSDILDGRPFGGCAIIWRASMNLQAMPIECNSRRVCGVLFTNQNIKLLCICVYMPFEHDASSHEEFQYQLSVIDSMMDKYSDCSIVIGGDFNVDFRRNWAHTELLNDFCMQSNLYPVIRHSSNSVDFTYQFNMRYFTCIDHFLVSDSLFHKAVNLQYVLHEVDNTSDHDPVCLVLDINVALVTDVKRAYSPQPSWNKASINNIENYKLLLRSKLAEIKVPTAAVCCSDVCCVNSDHFDSINLYVSQLADACTQAAEKTVPFTRRRGERGCIPGWSEHVAPLRDKSIFWHKIWSDCGRPHTGIVSDIMRKTRLQYHAAIRAVRRNENDIVRERFVSSVVNNSTRDFWHEAKRLRRKCESNTSSVVDGLTNAGDIASSFADKYSKLYTSVSYDDNEMSRIRSCLTESSVLSETPPVVSCVDVLHACAQLKTGKRDGCSGLVSDHFINACEELSVHTAMLFSTMLVHGFATEDMVTCTLIPIPKGKNVNVTDSGNYRGITLSSVFGKIFDLIFLNKFYDYLCTSERQFGFKRRHSTDMCTMVLKESLAYYTVDGGAAFCTFLDATKAFDRVNYCKLFSILLKRDIPAAYVRLLLNLYTNSVTRVSWNGVCSKRFPVKNGVRQGGIISPILFCVYIDGLLQRLYESGVGCYIGNVFVGALAYADDVVLLAPTHSAMRMMLRICEDFAKEFCVVFNPTKSMCMLVSKSRPKRALVGIEGSYFTLDGTRLSFVDKCMHLGHVLTSDLDDKAEVLHKRNSVCAKVNSVLCHFYKCTPLIKLKLLRAYCSDFYGSTLWNLSNPSIEEVSVAWRKGLRRALGLPWRTHTDLLAPITGMLPLRDELFCRLAKFVLQCLASDNSIVNFVARHGVYFRRMCSPIGFNTQLCCERYNVSLYSFSRINRESVQQFVFRDLSNYMSNAGIIYELLLAKSGLGVISSLSVADMDFIIHYLCVS